MATTYARINTVLQQASKRESWPTISDLATNIRQRKLLAFRIRGDGSLIEHIIQQSSLEALLRYCVDLDLLEINRDGIVTVPERSKKAIEAEDAFARQIRSSVKSLLQNRSAPFEEIVAIMARIKLPAVPDANTIYEALEARDPKPNLNENDLRKALYLLALADGLSRKVRVHYAQE